MLLCIICVFSIIQDKSFVLTYPLKLYNEMKNRARYQINEDLEMIKMEQKQRNVDFKNIEVKRLNKLASKEYERHLKTSTNLINDRDHILVLIGSLSDHTITTHNTPLTKRRIKRYNKQNVVDYNYNAILQEYFDEAIKEANSNGTYYAEKPTGIEGRVLENLNIIVPVKTSKGNMTAGHTWLYTRIFLNYGDNTLSPKESAEEFWNFIKVWLYVYLILAIPLWCTKGWCCCCLYCKAFKPKRTIENAKKYLILNPPGVVNVKGKEIVYDPTEDEKDAYEEFEHMIRTI